jgi:hypothetical protein
MDILEAAGTLVDIVPAFSGAEKASSNGDLWKALVFFGQIAVSVRQRHDNFCHIRGLRFFCSGKYHVFFQLAAELLDTLLTHDPLHSVYHVALAAAVGSDHGADPRRKEESGFVNKGLKTTDIQAVDIHRYVA